MLRLRRATRLAARHTESAEDTCAFGAQLGGPRRARVRRAASPTWRSMKRGVGSDRDGFNFGAGTVIDGSILGSICSCSEYVGGDFRQPSRGPSVVVL